MVTKKSLFTMLFVSSLFVVPGVCLAQAADNTGINKRDNYQQKITADQQSEAKADRDLTQKIRQAVIDDKSLSTNARNVKIITIDGIVTLKGPVGSENEKRIIEEKARQIAGSNKIKSEIEIAP